jgi:hypothetical protein
MQWMSGSKASRYFESHPSLKDDKSTPSFASSLHECWIVNRFIDTYTNVQSYPTISAPTSNSSSSRVVADAATITAQSDTKVSTDAPTAPPPTPVDSSAREESVDPQDAAGGTSKSAQPGSQMDSPPSTQLGNVLYCIAQEARTTLYNEAATVAASDSKSASDSSNLRASQSLSTTLVSSLLDYAGQTDTIANALVEYNQFVSVDDTNTKQDMKAIGSVSSVQDLRTIIALLHIASESPLVQEKACELGLDTFVLQVLDTFRLLGKSFLRQKPQSSSASKQIKRYRRRQKKLHKLILEINIYTCNIVAGIALAKEPSRAMLRAGVIKTVMRLLRKGHQSRPNVIIAVMHVMHTLMSMHGKIKHMLLDAGVLEDLATAGWKHATNTFVIEHIFCVIAQLLSIGADAALAAGAADDAVAAVDADDTAADDGNTIVAVSARGEFLDQDGLDVIYKSMLHAAAILADTLAFSLPLPVSQQSSSSFRSGSGSGSGSSSSYNDNTQSLYPSTSTVQMSVECSEASKAIRFLRQSSTVVLSYGCLILARLLTHSGSAEDQSIQDRIVTSGGLGVLVKCFGLPCTSLSIQYYGMLALRRLVSKNKLARSSIESEIAVWFDSFVSVMQRFGTYNDRILTHLSHSQRDSQQFDDRKKSMNSLSYLLAYEVVRVLNYFPFNKNKTMRLVFAGRDGISALVGMLRQHAPFDAALARSGLKLLEKFAVDKPAMLELIRNNGRSLLSLLLAKHGDDRDIAKIARSMLNKSHGSCVMM